MVRFVGFWLYGKQESGYFEFLILDSVCFRKNAAELIENPDNVVRFE